MPPTEPRRRPQQIRSHRRVTKILDAAIHVFALRGYGGTTTTAIAEAAGVSVGSVYQFFPNKEAILYALSERFDGSFFAWLDAAQASERLHTWQEWIDMILQALNQMDTQHPQLFQVLAHTYTSPEFMQAEQRFNAQLTTRIQHLLRPHLRLEALERLPVVAAVCVEITHALFHLASSGTATRTDVITETRTLLHAYLSTVMRAATDAEPS